MALLVRTSERSSFKRCRQQWDFGYNQCIKPNVEAPALRFGTLVHAALEARYPKGLRRGPHPAGVFEQLYEEELETAEAMGFKDDDGKWHDMAELGVAMLNGFVDRYHEEDKQYRVLAPEQVFQVPVKRGKLKFTYVGTIDLVLQDRTNKKIFFRDYKTCAAIGEGQHLALDEQAGAYWTYGPKWLTEKGLLSAGQVEKLSYIEYIFLAKKLPDERPVNELGQALNQDGKVSKQQPAPRFDKKIVYRSDINRRNVHERVLNEVAEMQAVRHGELAVYINPGGAPPLNNCQFCGYRDLCELKEDGADWESMRDMTMKTWEPYAAHDLDPKDY